jgi:hypothetical protein
LKSYKSPCCYASSSLIWNKSSMNLRGNILVLDYSGKGRASKLARSWCLTVIHYLGEMVTRESLSLSLRCTLPGSIMSQGHDIHSVSWMLRL